MIMSLTPIQSQLGLKPSHLAGGDGMAVGAPATTANSEDRAKAASLFSNLLLRQMFDPVLDPVVKGLQGSSSAGAGMYSHLIKDALVSAVSKGGAGGINSGIERQFYPDKMNLKTSVKPEAS